MHRIILACALAGVLGVPAKADETLKFRVEQYVATQFQQVGDVNNHVQGLQRVPGVASFPDGSTAKTLVLNAFERVPPVAAELTLAMKTSFSVMARSCGGNSTEHTRSPVKRKTLNGLPEAAPSL